MRTDHPEKDKVNIKQQCWSFIRERSSSNADGPGAVALSCGDRDYTYRQMFRRWERYAGAFTYLGITGKRRSRAGLLDIPAAETIFAFYALNMTGTSVSMIHPGDLRDADRLESMIRAEGITDLLLADMSVDRAMLEDLLRKRSGLGIRRIIIMHIELNEDYVGREAVYMSRLNYDRLKELKGLSFMDDLLERSEGYEAELGNRNNEAAYIAHTSGTVSGVHKPVPISDEGLNEAAARLLRDERFAGLIGRSVSGLYQGMSSAYAMADMVHLPLAFGGRILLMPGVRRGEDIVRIIMEDRANVLFSSGGMMESIMRMKDVPDLSSLELLFLGGGYVSAHAKRRYDDFLAGHGANIRATIGYGMSETAGACILADPGRRDDSMGRPLDGVRIRLRDESDGAFYDAADGPRRGVLYIGSPSVSSGRIGRTVFFRLEDVDGEDYLNTYDLVDVDASGDLYYAGRMNRYFVNNEGIRFDAGLIETAVSSKPGIRECAMAPGYDKSIHDTIAVLCVSIEGDDIGRKAARELTESVLREVFITDGLIGRTNLPGQCLVADAIPYTENGKVDTRRIVNGRVKGRLYRVDPVREGGELTDVQLMPVRDAFRMRAGIPEELDGSRDKGEQYEKRCLGRQGKECHRIPLFCPYGDQCPKIERAEAERTRYEIR